MNSVPICYVRSVHHCIVFFEVPVIVNAFSNCKPISELCGNILSLTNLVENHFTIFFYNSHKDIIVYFLISLIKLCYKYLYKYLCNVGKLFDKMHTVHGCRRYGYICINWFI